MVEYLCQQPSIKLDHETPNSEIALMEATKNNSPIIAEILLKNGANPNVQLKRGNVTPLHEACKKGYVEVIEVLKKFKADPLIEDDIKNIPINYLPDNLKDIMLKYINAFGMKKGPQRERRHKQNGKRVRANSISEENAKETNQLKSNVNNEEEEEENQITPIRSGRKGANNGSSSRNGAKKQQKTKQRVINKEPREIPASYKRIASRILNEDSINFYEKMTEIFIQYTKSNNENLMREFSEMMYSQNFQSIYDSILEGTKPVIFSKD